MSESYFDILRVFLFAASVICFTQFLIQIEKARTFLFVCLNVTAFCLSLIGLLQYFDVAFNNIPGNVIPYSTMANKNLFSAAIFFLLPFVIYGMFCFSKYLNFFSILTFIIVIVGIIITKTRTIWLAFAISFLMCFSFLLFTKLKNNKLIKRNLKPIIALFGLLVPLAGFVIYKNAGLANGFIGSQNILSLHERMILWSKTCSMIKDNLLTGVGAGNWKIVFPGYGLNELVREAKIGELHYQSPENDFLWVFAEYGIVGFASYVFLFLTSIFYATKIFFNTQNYHSKMLSITSLFGIIGYSVVSCFSFPKERIFLLLCLSVLLSSLMACYYQEFPMAKRSFKFHFRGLNLVFLLILSLAIYIGYSRMFSEMEAKKGIQARESSNYNYVVKKTDDAISPFYTLDPMATPLYFYRGTANFGLNKIREALNDFETAEKYHPYHIQNLNNIATCNELLGNHEKAIEYYEKTIAVSDKFQDAIMNLSAVYFNLKKYDKALETIKKCMPETKDMNRYQEVKKAIENAGYVKKK